MTIDLGPLTDEELFDLHSRVLKEIDRRQQMAEVPAQIAELNASYLAAEGVVPGSDWRQCSGAHDAYPLGFRVMHGGKEWESLIAANVWEPGTSGWRELVPEDTGPPEWIRPTGAHDAYKIGDQVTFQGEVYESLINGNTWSPTDYPQGWKLVT